MKSVYRSTELADSLTISQECGSRELEGFPARIRDFDAEEYPRSRSSRVTGTDIIY